MISVVCVYNNDGILKDNLVRSLESQTSKHESILIDNTQGRFGSAAEALNWGAAKAKGEYIMFVHQDVDLCSDSWIENAERLLASIPNLAIAGVAGMSDRGNRNKERGRNIIKHCDPATIWGWGNPIQKPEPVQTLDECLAIVPKSVFKRLQFDDKTCSDWHLYVVDYCLSVKRLGLDVYVLPLFIYHKSGGGPKKNLLATVLSLRSSLKEYYETLGELLEKHKNDYGRIYTTCGDWNTSDPIVLQRIRFLVKGGSQRLLSKLQKRREHENALP